MERKAPWASALAGVLALSAAAPRPTLAQESDGGVEGLSVRAIHIQGNRSVGEPFIRQQIEDTIVGRSYHEELVRADAQRLLRTMQFADVRPTVQRVGDEVEVTFVVEEYSIIGEIQFVGAKAVATEELHKLLDFGVGEFKREFQINAGRESIVRRYKQEGYYDVSVDLDRSQLGENRVVYRITEGPRVRVRDVLFVGNDSVKESRLKRELRTETYLWLLRRGVLDEELLEEDRVAVQDYYRGLGYLEARVGRRTEWSDDRRDATIVFVVQENARHIVEAVEFEGNTVFTDDELGDDLLLQKDEFFLRESLAADARHLTDKYGQVGYVSSILTANGTRIQPNIVFAETPGRVRVVFAIEEGQRFQIGRIVVRGNERTQDRVVRRQLNFFPEEEYNVTATVDAQRRLRQSRLFNNATVTPVGDEPGVRDVLVEVEEAETTNLLFGAGVSSDSGVLGNIQITENNFDLFDRPKTFGEFIRGQSFKGAGQIFDLRLEPGTDLTRGRISIREPWLLDKPIGLGWSAYLFSRGRDGYDEERIGTNVSVDRRYEKGWAIEVTQRVELLEVSDLTFLTAEEIRDDEGENLLTSTKFSIVRDTRDSIFAPTKGYLTSGSWEQTGTMGGDYSFSKFDASVRWFKTVHTDTLGRKSVLGLRAVAGVIFGDAPVIERFYAGGIGSVRGFKFRGISPRQGFEDDRIGGDLLLLAGAEYLFPLYEKQVSGVVFADMGTVEEDIEISTWRASVGIGLRLNLRALGPASLAFDLAAPIMKDGDDDTQIFSFSLGTTF
jgi:outer membrane protein assembly complex protein YaeT